MSLPTLHQPLLHRVAETGRAAVPFTLDGEPRAGFCMMGACQDCWIATEQGERLRACSTFIAPGMALVTGGSGA
jgi:hypothetical protein